MVIRIQTITHFWHLQSKVIQAVRRILQFSCWSKESLSWPSTGSALLLHKIMPMQCITSVLYMRKAKV